MPVCPQLCSATDFPIPFFVVFEPGSAVVSGDASVMVHGDLLQLSAWFKACVVIGRLKYPMGNKKLPCVLHELDYRK